MPLLLVALLWIILASCGNQNPLPENKPNRETAIPADEKITKVLTLEASFPGPTALRLERWPSGERGADTYYHLAGYSVAVVRPNQPALSLEGMSFGTQTEIVSPKLGTCHLHSKYFSMIGNLHMRVELAGVDRRVSEACKTFFEAVRNEGLTFKSKMVKRPPQFWDNREVVFDEVTVTLSEFASMGRETEMQTSER